MRSWYLVLLVIPSVASAQAQPAQAPLKRPTETVPPSPLEITGDATAVPLAGKGDTRILSKNEAYNIGRAAEGRVGVRLGNDVSFRITGN